MARRWEAPPIPEGPLYTNPQGLFPFQAEATDAVMSQWSTLAVWDWGIGKSHLGMASACRYLEEGWGSHVLIVCESDKVDEWVEDFEVFTAITCIPYHGTPQRRARIRADLPSVMVGTYETFRNDLASVTRRQRGRKAQVATGPLAEALVGSAVMVVYDEMSKLSNRGSNTSLAHTHLVNLLRRTGEVTILGITATPMERDPEGYYNLGRILCPSAVGTVRSFEDDHVVSRDRWFRPTGFTDIGGLADKMAHVVIRKRKSDPDVRDQFPRMVEEFFGIHLDPAHQELYEATEEILAEHASDDEEDGTIMVIRALAGHPMALTHSRHPMAQAIVERIGEDHLRQIKVAKVARLVDDLTNVVADQGAKAIVFTFFARAILPYLHEALDEVDGLVVQPYTGSMSHTAKRDARKRFRTGDANVLLASDAASRGINLPEATYTINFELPSTFARYSQRIHRMNRIDSDAEVTTAWTYVAHDTIEVPFAGLVLRTNNWTQTIFDRDLDDDDREGGYVTTADRRRLLADILDRG